MAYSPKSLDSGRRRTAAWGEAAPGVACQRRGASIGRPGARRDTGLIRWPRTAPDPPDEAQSVMAAGRHRRGYSAMPAPLGAPGRLVDYGDAAGVVAARLLVPGPPSSTVKVLTH